MPGTATAPTSTPTRNRGTSWGGMWRQGHERDNSLSLSVKRTPKAREEQRKGAAEGWPDVPGPSGTAGTSGLFARGGSQGQAVTWGQAAGRQPSSMALKGGMWRGQGGLRSHTGRAPPGVPGLGHPGPVGQDVTSNGAQHATQSFNLVGQGQPGTLSPSPEVVPMGSSRSSAHCAVRVQGQSGGSQRRRGDDRARRCQRAQ